MKLEIENQPQYSRLELLLRTFFGAFYIAIPHMFLLLFYSLWGSILTFIAWWVLLFTGRYPESTFEYNVKLLQWNTRVNASLYNLVDGYPAFGLNGSHPGVTFEVEYPENLSRAKLLIKTFFGPLYVLLPHMFVLIHLSIWAGILSFISWWVVLFTGRFPQSNHDFLVGLLRWSMRINLYYGYWMSDEYPPFSGKA